VSRRPGGASLGACGRVDRDHRAVAAGIEGLAVAGDRDRLRVADRDQPPRLACRGRDRRDAAFVDRYTTRPSGAGRNWRTLPTFTSGLTVFAVVSIGSTLLSFATYAIAGACFIAAVDAAAGDAAPIAPRAATAMRTGMTRQYLVLPVPAGIPVSPVSRH
jgi:hypothetical protein